MLISSAVFFRGGGGGDVKCTKLADIDFFFQKFVVSAIYKNNTKEFLFFSRGTYEGTCPGRTK